MASDTMRLVLEAEERAATIEREADKAAADLLAKAERDALEMVRDYERKTQEECRRILDDADSLRGKKEADALLSAREQARDLRANAAPRIPQAVAAVRNILIGKV